MKKISIAFLLLSFLSVFSQVRTAAHRFEVLDPNTAGKIFRNKTSGKDRPNGSPYLMKMFASAKVEGIAQNAFMRYNVYNDEFEFITNNNDTLVLDKIADFGTITFNGLNKKYQLTAYTNTKGKLDYGYLIDFYRKGGIVLYMKENIDFYEEKKAKTSLERDMPARYTKADDSYFLKVKEAAITEFPGGKKDLIKLFPDKKTEIETWLKANKVSFGDRADMVRIVDFLATL